MEFNVGDKIRVVYMAGEPQYAGKEGIIQEISKDPWGDLRYTGTWGGCAIYPSQGDNIELIQNCSKDK